MKTPIKLLYKEKLIAELENFGYEFPWACAKPKAADNDMLKKLETLSTFNKYSEELDDMDLSEDEEESLWE